MKQKANIDYYVKNMKNIELLIKKKLQININYIKHFRIGDRESNEAG